jgi:hypothetical protein
MKVLLFAIISLNVMAEMAPEESKYVDFMMIEQNMELRKKLGASFYDEIVPISGKGGDFYTVLKNRCIALVEIGRIESKPPMPGGSKRVIKDIKGPYCFRN